MNIYRIAAYITAYNDWDSIQRCIESIKRQTLEVEHLLIVDNSSTTVIPIQYQQLSWVTFLHFPNNIGVSGGLTTALNWFNERNYDFLWTFDQDSEAESHCLKNLILEYDNLSLSSRNKVGVIAPLPIDKNTNYEICGRDFVNYRLVPSKNNLMDIYSCDVVITSGSLIPLHVSQQVEPPSYDLFIDAVDWDYCIKVKEKGFDNYVVRKAILFHQFSDLEIKHIPILNKKILINHYSPLRHYFIARNHTYFYLKNTTKLIFLVLAFMNRILYVFKTAVKIILFEDKLIIKKLQAIIYGTFHGLKFELFHDFPLL